MGQPNEYVRVAEFPRDHGEVRIDYTNWRGERGWKTILPMTIVFGSNQWHTERQFLLLGIDVTTGEGRAYAMRSVHAIKMDDEGDE